MASVRPAPQAGYGQRDWFGGVQRLLRERLAVASKHNAEAILKGSPKPAPALAPEVHAAIERACRLVFPQQTKAQRRGYGGGDLK